MIELEATLILGLRIVSQDDTGFSRQASGIW